MYMYIEYQLFSMDTNIVLINFVDMHLYHLFHLCNDYKFNKENRTHYFEEQMELLQHFTCYVYVFYFITMKLYFDLPERRLSQYTQLLLLL